MLARVVNLMKTNFDFTERAGQQGRLHKRTSKVQLCQSIQTILFFAIAFGPKAPFEIHFCKYQINLGCSK